ncbi:hypothetical protein HZH66_013701 [Vespula vulgaris]|uniref:Uncharacterized protein n=1 Tax=Vespula vulgaris TaxID=7454 RepID=A0A834J5N9_VESVU|nr:hypothetical protein HZH66_013701 [Vespula vulgaris]
MVEYQENCKTTIAMVSTFIMSKLNVTPFGNRPLIGHAKICYASEKSEVDPVSREMVLKTRNKFQPPPPFPSSLYVMQIGFNNII